MAKLLVCIVFSALMCAPGARAADYGKFYGVTPDALKPFARDLGGLLGSGSNQTARPLGFAGFDVGVRGMAQLKPSQGDTVLKKDGLFGLGVVQAEIGMPLRLDGFVRGGSFEGITVAGAGLRYGLWNVSDEKYKINAMLVGMANMATHKYFYAVHFNTSLFFSVNVPVLAPYFSVGYDFTRLNAQTVADTALIGKNVRVTAPRFMAGLRAKIQKYGYLAAGAAYTHGRPLLNASAGFRF